MKRRDPEGAIGRRLSGIRRLKASATSGPMVAALTRHAVYLDHLLSTLDHILSGRPAPIQSTALFGCADPHGRPRRFVRFSFKRAEVLPGVLFSFFPSALLGT